LNQNGPIPTKPRADISPRHGFTESHSENMLRDSVLIAAAFTGAKLALVLRDETNTWYMDSSGLTSGQLAELEPALSQVTTHASGNPPLSSHGLQVVEALPLVDDCHRAIGTLCVLSPVPLELPAAHKEGLRLLAEHIQTIVNMDQKKVESRVLARAPSAASFVPGLVHELGSFIFGISANLDAFEARFSEREEVRKYAGHIRRSLDRMGDFIVELREYAYPQRLSWTILELEPLLRDAIQHLHSKAAKGDIDLQLIIEGALPTINADQQGLRVTIIRLIDLVLQQEEAGGQVTLRVAQGPHGNRFVVHGHLDFSNKKLKDLDTARLFEPFYFRVSGLGRLTLPGARRVFESHGGTLTVGPGLEGRMRINFMLPTELPYPLRTASHP
jgi:signal transduction histidine kinase